MARLGEKKKKKDDKSNDKVKAKSSLSRAHSDVKEKQNVKPATKEDSAKGVLREIRKPASNGAAAVASSAASAPAKDAGSAEMDFPRGAGPKAAPNKQAPAKLVHEEKGLFNDGLTMPAGSASKKGKRKDTDATAVTPSSNDKTSNSKKRKLSSSTSSKAKKSAPAASTSAVAAKGSSEDTFRVEHLSYKRLLPGPTVVLVQVVQILPLELVVSLPDQLMGHIPITNIASALTKRLEAEADAPSDDDDDKSEEEEEDSDTDSKGKGEGSSKLANLSDMFYVGQYLRAAVEKVYPPRATTAFASSSKQRGSEEWKSSRRAELSLLPSAVNAGVSLGDLKAGQAVLQGEVRSVEDNGYIVDFGLPLPGSKGAKEGECLSGFVGFKEEQKASKEAGEENWISKKLSLGGIVSARVVKVAENGRTCTVSILPSDVTSASVTNPPNITSLLPGTLVSGKVTAVTPSGLNVRFLTFFTGTIDMFHMLPSTSHTYKPNETLRARILWTTPPLGDAPLRFAMSALPHIVHLRPRTAPLSPGAAGKDGPSAPLSQVLPVGTFLEQVQVVKVDSEWGLLCLVPGTTLSAFVHISHVADLHLTSLAGSGPAAAYRPGSVHRARVIGYSALDGMLQASMQQSVLERKFMKVSDLKVGELIEDGTVQRLGDKSLFVNIHGNVAGIVWPNHYSDLKLKHPERKFKPGGKVKARILSLDPEKNRVVLTLRRSLVASDLPVLQSFSDAREGQLLHGTVQAVLEKGALVELFAGLRAFVPIGELADRFVSDVKKELSVGQSVRIRLIGVDKDAERLTGSIKQAAEDYQPPAPATEKGKKKAASEKSKQDVPDISHVELGDKVEGEVKDVHDSQIVLALPAKQDTKALLSISALAKHRSSTAGAVKGDVSIGDTLKDLVVVSTNPEKGLVIVGFPPSNKPSLVPSTAPRTGISANTEPLFTFDSLEEGQILDGTIGDQIPTGFFVQLSKGIRGKVAWTELADDYETVDLADLKKGAQVRCIITDYEAESKRIGLSLRQSRLDKSQDDAAEIRDPAIGSFDELKEDQTVRGFVKSISDSGLFVDVGKDLTARVQIRELFDEYVKDWKPRFAVGQLVSGKILSLNKESKKVELTLRKNEKVKRAKKDTEPTITFEGLQEGQVVKGVIKRIENYGAFIRVQGSTVSGLCHKSEVTDESKETWAEQISVGDEVRAVITKLDAEKRKISFSLKASKMPEGAEDEEDDGETDVMKQLNKLVQLQESASDDDNEEDSDEELEIKMYNDDEEEDDDDVDEDEEVEDAAPVQAAKPASTLPSLKLSNFKWDGQIDESMDVDGKEDADSEAESEASEDEAAKKAIKPKAKGILVNDRTADLENEAPTSASDFDRLLLASPNSSYLWIQYMSFYLQLSDVEQARQTAQRALKTINYREEEEKLNVWMAMINLENSSGNDETLEQTFDKAVQTNDPKQVYLRTLEVYEQTEKYDREEQLFERFVKKFNMSSKVWTLYGQFLLNRGRGTESRDLLPRSLKSLPKRKHVKTISKFAQMEFKSGDPERGRTIFEGIVDTYPKRLDLWWVYLDQEIRLRNVVGVRALFDRVLAQKLSSKKTKSLLKKWLSFEKQYGDEAGAETVKQRAIAYVEQMQQ